MVDALQDCAILVEKCRHLDPPDHLLSQLKKELCDYIKEYVSCTCFLKCLIICLLILKGFIQKAITNQVMYTVPFMICVVSASGCLPVEFLSN